MTYPERMTRRENGSYFWRYTLTREQALGDYYVMLKVCAIIATICAAIMTFMFYMGDMLTPGYLFMILGSMYGGILGLPALASLLVLNHDTRSFEMDWETMRQKHATKGGDAVVHFARVKRAWQKDNAFRFKEGISTLTMYVPPEDLDFAASYIRGRVGYDKFVS